MVTCANGQEDEGRKSVTRAALLHLTDSTWPPTPRLALVREKNVHQSVSVASGECVASVTERDGTR